MSLLANLPPVIQPQPLIDVPEPVVADADNKRKIIILYTKDILPEEKASFKLHGKCLLWDDRWKNIPMKSLPHFDYLFCDMRDKATRTMLGSTDLSQYSTVAYVSWYQKSEDFISQLESIALTKIPDKAISKEDFDYQLLHGKLKSPSIIRTFLGFVLGCVMKQ
jgi:hypothetical protein